MHTSAGGPTKCGSPRVVHCSGRAPWEDHGRGAGTPRTPWSRSVPSDFLQPASATWPKRSRTSLLRDRRPATSFCQESPKRPPGCPAVDGVSKTPEEKKEREIGLRHVDGRSSAANDGRLTLPGRKRRKKEEIFTTVDRLTGSAPVSDRREKGWTHRAHPIRSAPHELTNRANSNDVPFSQLCDPALFPGRGSRRRPISTPQGNCSCGTEYRVHSQYREHCVRRADDVGQLGFSSNQHPQRHGGTLPVSAKKIRTSRKCPPQPARGVALALLLSLGRVPWTFYWRRSGRGGDLDSQEDQTCRGAARPRSPPPHDAGARPYNSPVLTDSSWPRPLLFLPRAQSTHHRLRLRLRVETLCDGERHSRRRHARDGQTALTALFSL